MIEGNRPGRPTKSRWPFTYYGTVTIVEAALILALLVWRC